MEPALDVINRALHGDSGARSFLERTVSLYVLDVTDTTSPKTYGCWNFIHQSMNEVERYEARLLTQETSSRNLVDHVRMLSSMALKVARRGPAVDKALVITCISNASQYNGSADQSQWLVDLNLELREIVMGRIAAMAFDFSFHKRNWPSGRSAFADHVVMDTFCAVLSANAVASGPEAVRNFVTEWIIPSAKSLPIFSVSSVVLHLAAEGMRKLAPAGTKDVLQQLSFPTMSIVLVPVLIESVAMTDGEGNGDSSRDETSRIAAMTLRAMKAWCDSTDLSLPLIKHICSKVNVNVIDVLSDTMYSDSPAVIDSLAEFIECTVVLSDEKIMSQGRLSQVRHIIQPDIISFQTQVTGQQLKTIESREMSSIIDELLLAIGLQRFRFSERQSKGDFDVCHNLARIASSICSTWVDIANHSSPAFPRSQEGGAVSLLIKGANHPFVNVCAVSLPVLTRMMPLLPSLCLEVLPILQRRAIIPHNLRGGQMDMDAVALCGITFYDFNTFRTTILSDALVACWKEHSEQYMDSCTSAIEEFCSTASAINVSLQLEAALFCIEQISLLDHSEPRIDSSIENVMNRLIKALLIKPPSLMFNPLTRERMCRLIRFFSSWFTSNRMSNVAMDLLCESFNVALTPDPNFAQVIDHDRDESQSSVHELSLAINEVLQRDPRAIIDSKMFPSLLGLWEKVQIPIERSDIVHVSDRIAVCTGIGYVVAILPDDQKYQAFEGMIKLPLNRLESWLHMSKQASSQERLSYALKNVGEEISVFATICQLLVLPPSDNAMSLEIVPSSLHHGDMPEIAISWFRMGWPLITMAATQCGDDENVALGLSNLLVDLLPTTCVHENNLKLIKEFCQLASIIQERVSTNSKQNAHVHAIFRFVKKLLALYGGFIESNWGIEEAKKSVPSIEIESDIKTMIWKTIEAVQTSLGHTWMHPVNNSEQGNGQVAFESKASPTTKRLVKKSNMESISGVLSFLTQGLVSCPTFILHIPVVEPIQNGLIAVQNDSENTLIRRATDTAIFALHEHNDTEQVQSATLFLTALVHYTNKVQWKQYTTDYDIQWITHLFPDIICKLMIGACGKYNYNVLDNVAELLLLLLQSINLNSNNNTQSSFMEMELYIFSSIRQQYDQIFLIGGHARRVCQQVLFRCCDTTLTNTNTNVLLDITVLLQDIWQLHQIDEPTALPGSDGVHQFIAKYSNVHL